MIDADVTYIKGFYSSQEANSLFNILHDEIAWKQEHIRIYGKEIPFPRLTAWYGDPDKQYKYSGIINTPLLWTDTLTDIRNKIQNATGHEFNSVLLNLYRDGNDCVGWHQDNEQELGDNPVIASLSLGADRKFQMRHKKRKDAPPLDISLSNGSLLLMAGTTQAYWKHQLPRTKEDVGARVNLTFRRIV